MPAIQYSTITPGGSISGNGICVQPMYRYFGVYVDVEARWGLLPPGLARREWSTISAGPTQLSRIHLPSTPNVVYTFPVSMGCQVFVHPITITTTISLEVGVDLRPPSASTTQKFFACLYVGNLVRLVPWGCWRPSQPQG